MSKQPTAILALPEEEEIERTEEIRVTNGANVVKQTIRYKNGMLIVMIKDFRNNVFHIELRPDRSSFWMSRNHVFLVASKKPANPKRNRFRSGGSASHKTIMEISRKTTG